MYHAFAPKGRFQGLPPVEKAVCNTWIKKLVYDGENYLVLREDSVIGHVAVLPDAGNVEAEWLIFVDQFNRGIGIGTAIIRAAIKQAEETRIKLLWLIIDAQNIRAMSLYSKCGFVFSFQHNWKRERMMSYRCKGLGIESCRT
jgi:GNAT superfamily N-acetyltransferase